MGNFHFYFNRLKRISKSNIKQLNFKIKFINLFYKIRNYHLNDFTYSNTKTFRNIIYENETKEENIYFLKILEIRKNEHFDDILMFLNKRSPLSIKTKTKFYELFYLNKTDTVEISSAYFYGTN